MKKIILSFLIILLMAFGITGFASAKLTVIGYVDYQTSPSNTQTYLLIWDDSDNNGESVVWLDYTNYKRSWDNQQQWLDLLNGNGFTSVITKITLNPGYTVDWGNNLWHLPDTVDGVFNMGYNGTTTGGYNISSSELGHLFYKELGNRGAYTIDAKNETSFGLINRGPFEHIAPYEYWSGTTYKAETNPARAWYFNFANGLQGVAPKVAENTNINYPYALALRKAKVTYIKPSGSIAPVTRPRDIGLSGKKAIDIRDLRK